MCRASSRRPWARPRLGLLAGRVHLDHHSQLTRADPRAFLQNSPTALLSLFASFTVSTVSTADSTPVTRALTLLRWDAR